MALGATLAAGATLVLHEIFEPGEALALAARERATSLQVWPHQAKAMAEHADAAKHDLSSVRKIEFGSPLAKLAGLEEDEWCRWIRYASARWRSCARPESRSRATATGVERVGSRSGLALGFGTLRPDMSRAVRAPEPKARDERSLVLRLQAGDEAAFAELVHENMGRLLAVARRMLRAEDDARDALQEAFLQAFRGIGRFEGGARLSTWLHRIVINACLMKLRSCGRLREDSIEELLPRFYADGHRIDPGPPWRSEIPNPAESRELRTLVRVSIDQLPEIYRSVLLLRDIEELSTEETAQLLDVKADTVKVRLHRARQALRALLGPHFAQEAP